MFGSDEVAAYSQSAGLIQISPKLIDMAGTESELACVIGHEVAHQFAQHGEEHTHLQALLLASQCLFWRTSIPGVLLVALGSTVPPLSALYIPGLILACPVVLAYLFDLHWARLREYEADHIGISLMTSAGYDPTAAPSMMQKAVDMQLGQIEKFFKEFPNGFVWPVWLRSHPFVRLMMPHISIEF